MTETILDRLRQARAEGYRIVPWPDWALAYDSAIHEGNVLFLFPGILEAAKAEGESDAKHNV